MVCFSAELNETAHYIQTREIDTNGVFFLGALLIFESLNAILTEIFCPRLKFLCIQGTEREESYQKQNFNTPVPIEI